MSRRGATVPAHSGVSESDPQAEGKMLFRQGVLHVQIYRARDIKGDEMGGLGKADPYLKVKHGTALNRVTLRSRPHQDAGATPTWNTEFSFPMQNGGTKHHNILAIEIWNKNTRWRKDNKLGYLSIGELADWIGEHASSVTDPRWYPVFHKHHRPQIHQTHEKKGEILMSFSFEDVPTEVFAQGRHTVPKVTPVREIQPQSDDFSVAEFKTDGGTFAKLAAILWTVPTIIPLL